MYLYDSDPLEGYPQTVGPGIDPVGSQKTFCPLLRQNGKDLEWIDYGRRSADAADPLSKYQKFLNEVAYRAYLESCKGDSIKELIKRLKLFPIPTPPGPPPQRDWLTCRTECNREMEKCPGGARNIDCQKKRKECVRNCMGVAV